MLTDRKFTMCDPQQEQDVRSALIAANAGEYRSIRIARERHILARVREQLIVTAFGEMLPQLHRLTALLGNGYVKNRFAVGGPEGLPHTRGRGELPSLAVAARYEPEPSLLPVKQISGPRTWPQPGDLFLFLDDDFRSFFEQRNLSNDKRRTGLL